MGIAVLPQLNNDLLLSLLIFRSENAPMNYEFLLKVWAHCELLFRLGYATIVGGKCDNAPEFQNRNEVNGMELYADRIAQNEQKIQQLTKNIKRDTDKRKKLMEENDRLSYLSICEQYNCNGRELIEILNREHQQAEKLKSSKVSEKETSRLPDNDSGEIAGQTSFFEK